MNIILIAVDTLSARHMSGYGYTRDTTPFMDEYAKDSTLFESLYCQAIPTQPSFTSLYTGQYAVTHGIVSHGGDRELDKEAPFLPEILQQYGYTTCAVDNLYSHKEWFVRGYEFYINPTPRGEYAQETPCESFNARAIPWLKSHADERFFLFVHYWDPHTPYLPPAKYRHLFYDGDPCDPENRSLEGLWQHPVRANWRKRLDQLMPGITDAEYIVAMYDSEIRYADDGVRELIGTLDELGLVDDTLVVITSDHGEMMYKHGIYFDHHGLYDDDIHVPLVIRWPGATKRGARVPHLVQHIDVAPTILDMAGIPIPSAMEGRSLVPYVNGQSDEPIYPFLVALECTRMMKWGLRTDRHKYILARTRDYRKGPMRELYHLESDPHEMRNVADECPGLAETLEDTLEGWIAKMMKENGLSTDPLIANGLTLGTRWIEWVEEHGYW